MSGTLCGRNLLTRRVRDVLGGQHLHPPLLHPKPTSTPSTQSLSHPPLSLTRNYTLNLSLPRQPCFLYPSLSPYIHPSASLPSPSLSVPCNPLSSTFFSTSPINLKSKIRPTVVDKPIEKKHNSYTITLIDVEDKVSTITLDKAQRLAKKQDLKLVKIEDPSLKKNSNVYKLLTGKQYFEEQMKKKGDKKPSAGVKDEKILPIRAKITPHDLSIKLQSVSKWLRKGHQIKVSLSSRKATKEEVENVFTTIEEEVMKGKGRILQRHEKLNEVRFYIAPPKDTEESVNNKTTHSDDSVQNNESSDNTKGGIQ